jgi:hypothetical protein
MIMHQWKRSYLTGDVVWKFTATTPRDIQSYSPSHFIL